MKHYKNTLASTITRRDFVKGTALGGPGHCAGGMQGEEGEGQGKGGNRHCPV